MPNRTGEVVSIQHLRAVAALAVVVFHLSERLGGDFTVGAAGVDLFFVISGFIMWFTTQGRAVSPRSFVQRRLIRIAPLYWLVTLVAAGFIALKPNFFPDYQLTLERLAGSLSFWPQFVDGRLHPTLEQGWTLTYELFFYAVFAVGLLAPSKPRLALITGALVALACLHVASPPGAAAVFTDPILLEFAAGVVIGCLATSSFSLAPAASAAIVGLGVIGLVGSQVSGIETPRVVFWGVPASLIVFGMVMLERRVGHLKVKLLHFLGNASYSIYLWHTLVLVAADAILLKLGLDLWLRAVLLLVSAIGVSSVLYLAVEKPLVQGLLSQARSGTAKRSKGAVTPLAPHLP